MILALGIGANTAVFSVVMYNFAKMGSFCQQRECLVRYDLL